MKVTLKLWRYMLDVNLSSLLNLCHAVVPDMIQQELVWTSQAGLRLVQMKQALR
jgi:NADP-dependent 3-hydroxy acid dehydrogenase YdfG